MNIKVDKYLIGDTAVIQKYKIFERKIYDKDRGIYVSQNPTAWNDDSTAVKGKYYIQDSQQIVDKNYNLYAIWPEVNVYVYYNLFNTVKPHEVAIYSEYVLEDMSDEVEGFKGWLDRNREIHLPGSILNISSNTQLFLSTNYEISISYDLNGGYLGAGKKANPQTSLYSKWMNPDYTIQDTPGSIIIRADDPITSVPDAQFGYWIIDGDKYHRGDPVVFNDNMTAYAQWLYTPDYSFFENTACIGDHDAIYGSIILGPKRDTPTEVGQMYTAVPVDGYKFEYFSMQVFDGYAWKPEETYSASSTKEAVIPKLNPIKDDLIEKLYAQMNTIAYFSKDFDNWFRIFQEDDTVRLAKRPSQASDIVTNQLLQTAGKTNVIKVQFPTDKVEHIENGIFAGCTNLIEIQIATKLKEFPADVCKNDVNLTAITYSSLPAELTAIGNGAFEECSKLVDIGQQIINNVTSFGSRSFYGTAVNSFSFSDRTTSIGNSIFGNTPKLTEITLNASDLNVFSNNALDGSSITKIILTNIPSTSILGG